MKVGIAGLGVIGSACKYGFEKLGHEVLVHDPKLNTKLEDILDTQIVYICVPTPSNEDDGSCNTQIVEGVVKDLMELKYNGIISIKSTVEPGTTQRLIDYYSNDKICFVPEFLKERNSYDDFVNHHTLLAIGSLNQAVFEKIVECHGKYPQNIVLITPIQSELLKYYSNTWSATRITFVNSIFEICEALNTDYNAIKSAFLKLGTCNDMYMDANPHLRGYGGPCLPKDMKALDALVKKLNLDLKFFEMIDKENSKFKITVFDGMREK